jgi:hypothetical protein
MFSRNITVFEISAVASVVHDAIFKARKFIFHYFHRIILTVHAMAGFCGEVRTSPDNFCTSPWESFNDRSK